MHPAIRLYSPGLFPPLCFHNQQAGGQPHDIHAFPLQLTALVTVVTDVREKESYSHCFHFLKTHEQMFSLTGNQRNINNAVRYHFCLFGKYF